MQTQKVQPVFDADGFCIKLLPDGLSDEELQQINQYIDDAMFYFPTFQKAIAKNRKRKELCAPICPLDEIEKIMNGDKSPFFQFDHYMHNFESSKSSLTLDLQLVQELIPVAVDLQTNPNFLAASKSLLKALGNEIKVYESEKKSEHQLQCNMLTIVEYDQKLKRPIFSVNFFSFQVTNDIVKVSGKCFDYQSMKFSFKVNRTRYRYIPLNKKSAKKAIEDANDEDANDAVDIFAGEDGEAHSDFFKRYLGRHLNQGPVGTCCRAAFAASLTVQLAVRTNGAVILNQQSLYDILVTLSQNVRGSTADDMIAAGQTQIIVQNSIDPFEPITPVFSATSVQLTHDSIHKIASFPYRYIMLFWVKPHERKGRHFNAIEAVDFENQCFIGWNSWGFQREQFKVPFTQSDLILYDVLIHSAWRILSDGTHEIPLTTFDVYTGNAQSGNVPDQCRQKLKISSIDNQESNEPDHHVTVTSLQSLSRKPEENPTKMVFDQHARPQEEGKQQQQDSSNKHKYLIRFTKGLDPIQVEAEPSLTLSDLRKILNVRANTVISYEKYKFIFYGNEVKINQEEFELISKISTKEGDTNIILMQPTKVRKPAHDPQVNINPQQIQEQTPAQYQIQHNPGSQVENTQPDPEFNEYISNMNVNTTGTNAINTIIANNAQKTKSQDTANSKYMTQEYLDKQPLIYNPDNDKIMPQKKVVVTFFVYFKHFEMAEAVHIYFYKRKHMGYGAPEKIANLQEIPLKRVEGAKRIWYKHMLLQDTDLTYKYSFDFRKPHDRSLYCARTDNNYLIDRKTNFLNSVNKVVFDTPREIGNFNDRYSDLLVNYTKFYARNSSTLNPLFFQNLNNFTVKLGYNYKQQLVLDAYSIKSIPQVNKMIYQNQLKKLELKSYKNYNYEYIRYQVDLAALQNEKATLLNLPDHLRYDFQTSLKNSLTGNQSLMFLTMDKVFFQGIALDDIPFSKITEKPKDHVMKSINFAEMNDELRTIIFKQIKKFYNASLPEMIQVIERVNPSFDLAIEGIENAINQTFYQQYYNVGNKNQTQKIIQTFFSDLKSQDQKIKIIASKVIFEQLLNQIPSQLLKDVLQVFKCSMGSLQINRRITLLQVLINEIKPNSIKDNWIPIIGLIDILRLGTEELPNLYRSLIDSLINKVSQSLRGNQGDRSMQSLICSINANLQDNVLQDVLINNVLNYSFRQSQENLQQLTTKFKDISESPFVQSLSDENRKAFIVKIFELIVDQRVQATDISVLGNKQFVQLFEQILKMDLVDSCRSAKKISNIARQIFNQIRDKSAKLQDIKNLLRVKEDSLVNFCHIVEIQLDQGMLKNLKDEFEKGQVHLLGLKQFAYIMEELNLGEHEQFIQRLKEVIEAEQEMTLQEFENRNYDLPSYSCEDFLYYLSDKPLVYRYLRESFKKLKMINQSPQTEQQLNNAIESAIKDLKAHFTKLSQYGKPEDTVTIQDVKNFWQSYTDGRVKADDDSIRREINMIINFFKDIRKDTDQNLKDLSNDNRFSKDLEGISNIGNIKNLLKDLSEVIQYLNLQDVFIQDFKDLEQIGAKISELNKKWAQDTLKFSELSALLQQVLIASKDFIFSKEDENDLKGLIAQTKNAKQLINYLKKLESDKIRLEDLVDVIDDTAEETDALVQEMMEVRNAFYLILYDDHFRVNDDIDTLPIIQSCLKRYQNFIRYIRSKDRLQATINRCIDNLDTISMKISSQVDRAAKTIQTMESFKSHMKVSIEQTSEDAEFSRLSFIARNQVTNNEEVMNVEDLQILCNRYLYIKNNKSNAGNQNGQETPFEEDQSEKIILQILDISQDIRYLLDNLRNLGHPDPEYQFTQFHKEGKVDILWAELQDICERMYQENEINQQQLEAGRSKFISLNLIPPSELKHLHILLSQENYMTEVMKQDAFDRLKTIAHSYNRDESFIEDLMLKTHVDFINDVRAVIKEKNLKPGFETYGYVLDQMIQLPKVQSSEKPQYMRKFTDGFKVQCVRMNHKNEIWQNIISIFLGHNQKPHAWQILFCTPQTQIYELQQFAQLALNINKLELCDNNNDMIENIKPLFLMVSFENLPLIVQRKFVDILEEMYESEQEEEREFINLLITYFGSSKDEIIDKSILEQFRNQASYIEKDRIKMDDFDRFGSLDQMNTVSLFWSKFSGYGKTYQIYKLCREQRSQNIEIPIYGETTNLELLQLIKQKLQNSSLRSKLHLNVYPMNQDQNIHAILFQILVMRKFSTSLKSFIQIPNDIEINIEIQNSFRGVHENDLQYLQKFVKIQNRNYISTMDAQLFDVSMDPASDIQIALKYLRASLDGDKLKQFVVNPQKDVQDNVYIEHDQAIELIQTNFLNRVTHNPSFYHLTCILKFFIRQAMLFHNCGQLDPETLKWTSELGGHGIDLSIRKQIFQGIVETAVPYSCQTESNNYNSYSEGQLNHFDALEKRNTNIRGWDDGQGAEDAFFQTFSHDGTLVEIYNDPNSVPLSLKQYYAQLQRQFLDWDDPQNDIDYLKINKEWKPKHPNFLRDQVLVQLCTQTRLARKVKEDLDENFHHLALTKTIARKICLMFIKLMSGIPTLIMGETGVGKTILVNYLSRLIDGGIFTLNVHAGQSQNDIINWIENIVFLYQCDFEAIFDDQISSLTMASGDNKPNTEIFKKMQQLRLDERLHEGQVEKKQIILFLDEINTNENINGVLKEILIDRKVKGKPLPDNFIPLAAANPYKFKTLEDQEDNTDSLKLRGCENKDTSRLVYHVHPLPESMNTFIWDFGKLEPKEEVKIVDKMVQGKCQRPEVKGRIPNFHKTLVETITNSQEFSRRTQSVRSVSLRDVERFLRVFLSFLLQQNTDGVYMRQPSECLLLTVFYSYYCRFNTLQIREELCEFLDQKVNEEEGRQPFQINCKKAVMDEMNQIQNVLNLSDFYKSIAFTDTLRENLFMTMISVLNQLPIIIVGPPGSSKTLCTRLLHDSMKGKNSKIEYFKSLPNLMYKTYQCSVLSTPDSIEKAFKNAKQASQVMLQNKNEERAAENIVALILDEIGLAEASASNPLKVLHRLLEDPEMVPMIGLSNWSLDASKMNRVVFANRPILSEKELKDAALAIWNRVFEGVDRQAELDRNMIIEFAKDSFGYFESLKKQKKFFHGTRDFYNCVTYVCTQLRDYMGNHSEESILRIKFEAILRNFAGQLNMTSTLQNFIRSLRPPKDEDDENQIIGELSENQIKAFIQRYYEENLDDLNVKQQIAKNIADINCRNLMIIVDDFEYALNYMEKICHNRQYKIFQGSDLQDDFTEQNAFKMLNEIITCMEEGFLIIMHGLENLYQSFYDLFNQNYVELGAKKFCRIAIGADAIRGKVHSNFKAIVIAENKNIIDPDQQNYDPPLLNRFEKQYLDVRSLLGHEEKQFKDHIQEFLNSTGSVKSDRRLLQKQIRWQFEIKDMFPNIINQEDTLFSLTVKNFIQGNNEERLEESRKQLIDLATPGGVIRGCLTNRLDIRYFHQYMESNEHFCIKSLIESITHSRGNGPNEDEEMIDEGGIVDIMDDFKLDDSERSIEDLNGQFGQNIVIYTPSYDYDYHNNSNLRRMVMETQIDQIESLTMLKRQAQDFFKHPTFTSLIIVSSVLDSRMKILYIKKTMLEERNKFYEIFKEQVHDKPKNIIIVIKTINQQSNFQGFLQDKDWRQIYMDSTKSPQSKLDDIKSYLKPIAQVMESEEIMSNIIELSVSHAIQQVNYDGIQMNEEQYKERQDHFKYLIIKRDSYIRTFLQSEIIQKIDKLCQSYEKIGMRCEWFHYVSTLPKLNREENNSFLSCLKVFLSDITKEILSKLFYIGEQNGVISSLQANILFQEHLDSIQKVWVYLYTQMSGNALNCDHNLEDKYPFTHQISLQVERYRQLYMDKVYQECQLEERIKKRVEEEYEQDEPDEQQVQGDEIDEEGQINSMANNKVSREEKAIEDDEKIYEMPHVSIITTVLNDMGKQFEDEIGKFMRIISEINPKSYFYNLQFHREYTWTSSVILREIVEMIASSASKHCNHELTVSTYHSILWINEDVFKQLSPVWELCENFKSEITKQRLQILKKSIDQILQSAVDQNAKKGQNKSGQRMEEGKNSDGGSEEEEDEDEDEEEMELNFIEEIWESVLIFTAQIMNVFTIPNQDINADRDWLLNLKKCQGIIISFFNEYKIQPDEMVDQIKKFNFIIEISSYFSNTQQIREKIMDIMCVDNEFIFVTEQNFERCLQLCNEDSNDLRLFLIWRLIVSDDFKEKDILDFDQDKLKGIIQTLHSQINALNLNNFSNSEQDSHIFVFTKRIMKNLMNRVFESLENDKMFTQHEHEEFKMMAEIFKQLNIKLTDPICSIIDDVIEEKNFYSTENILDNLGEPNDNEELIQINFVGADNLRQFLDNVYDPSRGTFLNVIDFVLLKQICQIVCLNVHAAFCNQNPDDYTEDDQEYFIYQVYQKDQRRKQELLRIFNSHLKVMMNVEKAQMIKIKPMTPLIVARLLKKAHDFKDLYKLKDYIEIFKDENLFQEMAIECNYRERKNLQVQRAFDKAIQEKNSQALKAALQQSERVEDFQFKLVCSITDFMIQHNADFETCIQVIEQLNAGDQLGMDTYVLQESRQLYLQLKQRNQGISDEFWKSFVMILVTAAQASNQSFIKKLVQGQINVSDSYVPFVIDSDGIMEVREELKTVHSIRRYQCQNCVKLGHKPYIWMIRPCCMPSGAGFKCPQCQHNIKMADHYSNDLMPPTTTDNKQEPILQKVAQNMHYSYYDKPNFPYKYSVELLEDFIARRGRIEKGYQSNFDIQSKKLRQIPNYESILVGRLFMLPLIALCTHIIVKEKGQDEAQKQVGYSEPNDIFLQIYQREQLRFNSNSSTWNLLKEIGQEEHNLYNYIVDFVVKNFIALQRKPNSSDKQPLNTDQMRLNFEKQFSTEVIDQDALANLRNYTDSQEQQNQQQLQENQMLKEIIVKNNLENLSDDYLWLRGYQNLYRQRRTNKLDNFVMHFQIKQQGPNSEFIRNIHNFKQQIMNCSRLYPIQNWIKRFNEVAFDQIDEKQSETVKIQDFIQRPFDSIGLQSKQFNLKREYEQMIESWNYYRQMINEGALIIGPDCAVDLQLDDLEKKNNDGELNQKIAVFCLSENNQKRGYPLLCLLNAMQNQQKIFISQLQDMFPKVFAQIQSKTLFRMNRKNFIPEVLFEEQKAEQIFEEIIQKYFAANPLMQNEKEFMYDYKSLTRELIQEQFSGICYIKDCPVTESERFKLKNFRFKGDIKADNVIGEFPEKIKQFRYPYMVSKGLTHIDITNNETRHNLKEILNMTMSIIVKVQTKELNGEIELDGFMKAFSIQKQQINFDKEKINLCHLMHIYEVIEKMESVQDLKDDSKLNPFCKEKLTESQEADVLQFCKENKEESTLLMDVLARFCIRHLFTQEDVAAPKEGLFYRFEFVEDSYIPLWGIENSSKFQYHVHESGWKDRYSIFNYERPSMIKISQAYYFYKAIKDFHSKVAHEKQQLEKIKQDNLQKDLRRIDREQVMGLQSRTGVQKKKKVTKKSYKERE